MRIGEDLDKAVFIKRSVVERILSHARVLLLKGKCTKRDLPSMRFRFRLLQLIVKLSPTYMLPIDFSFIGVAHSLPSGALRPPHVDLNKFSGKVMLITTYPYLSEKNMALFIREGKQLKFVIV